MIDENRKTGTAAKVLMPVLATLASAVASYVAKKGPQYLEQTVLPKLRDTKDSSGDVAHDLADRARSVVGRDGDSDDGGDSEERTSKRDGDMEQSDVSNDELERRRRERAEHRAARRKAS